MFFTLRQLTLALTFTLPLCGLVNTTFAADSVKPLRVLASLPITYGLGEVLLKGTDVNLERAAPANLPGSPVRPRTSRVVALRRWPNWRPTPMR